MRDKIQKYKIKIDNKWKLIIRDSLKNIDNFQAPVTRRNLEKIYILLQRGRPIYIGITRQSIRSRLRYGIKCKIEKPRGGYHGYKWAKINSNYELYIQIYPNKKRQWVETVEAELVFLIRKKMKQWPASQTEIHFHCSNKTHRSEATRLFELCTKSGANAGVQ